MINKVLKNSFRVLFKGISLEQEINITQLMIAQHELKLTALNRQFASNTLSSSQTKNNINATEKITKELVKQKSKLKKLERQR